jgi:glycine cleavage system aminomethyltransferase T
MDDGVVARLDEDTFLCHTTTGGADRIHAHMEDWLQCEWWDWQVYTANVTEQWAQIAVVGPKARRCWKSSAATSTCPPRRCPSWPGPRAGSAASTRASSASPSRAS